MEIDSIGAQNKMNNTTKPLPDWENDYTTDSLTKFRLRSFIEDYDPFYRDPDYTRDPYWDDALYDQQQLQFHHNLSSQNEDH